ncbi:MAG: FkbM family methyltransferase [Saprospiraceae bacterium]|nr:FkbM family methyltransferase [Saprospiraceae bacterium]
MLHWIRKNIKKNIFFRKMIGYHLASSGLFDAYFKNYELSEFWQKRVLDVLSSPDLHEISTVPNAGQISGGKQIMHNGLRIHIGSYYGPEYARMLIQSKGIHEPQEERVFQEVLKTLPPNSTMIELGAFWSFYSMWFQQKIKGAKNYMIEPDAFNLGHGRRNFKLNGFNGDFTQAFVGKESKSGQPQTICIDDFAAAKKIDFIDMLHCDIQGYEYEMLQGAIRTFQSNKIGYVFISTHNKSVHDQCTQFLIDKSFTIIAAADMQETYSEDGFIGAKAPGYDGLQSLHISKKKGLDTNL